MSGRVVFALTAHQAELLTLLGDLGDVPYRPSQPASKVLNGLARRGLVERGPFGWRLTPSGEAARALVTRLAMSPEPREEVPCTATLS